MSVVCHYLTRATGGPAATKGVGRSASCTAAYDRVGGGGREMGPGRRNDLFHSRRCYQSLQQPTRCVRPSVRPRCIVTEINKPPYRLLATAGHKNPADMVPSGGRPNRFQTPRDDANSTESRNTATFYTVRQITLSTWKRKLKLYYSGWY